MKSSKIAVVVLNYNGRQLLERFLARTLANSPEARVIVADNASTDDSLRWLHEKYPDLETISLSENLGYAGGYNAALSQVQADIYILLNSDAAPAPGWLPPIRQALAPDRMAAVQPKILNETQQDRFDYAGGAGGYLHWLGYPTALGRKAGATEVDEGQYDNPRKIDWASGAALAIKAQSFHEMGGFQEAYFAHMEEIDLCWRLRNSGYEIMSCPESVVYHLGGATLATGSERKYYLNFRNNVWMLRQNGFPKWLFPLRLFLDCGFAASRAIIGRIRLSEAVFRAIWQGYFGSLPQKR